MTEMMYGIMLVVKKERNVIVYVLLVPGRRVRLSRKQTVTCSCFTHIILMILAWQFYVYSYQKKGQIHSKHGRDREHDDKTSRQT